MRVLFHPDFPKDVRRFEAEYPAISVGLTARFRRLKATLIGFQPSTGVPYSTS